MTGIFAIVKKTFPKQVKDLAKRIVYAIRNV